MRKGILFLSLIVFALTTFGCQATKNMFGPGPEYFGGTKYNSHVIGNTGMYWQVGFEPDVVGSYADVLFSAVIDIPGLLVVGPRRLIQGAPQMVHKSPIMTAVVDADSNIYFSAMGSTIYIDYETIAKEVREKHPDKTEDEIEKLAADEIGKRFDHLLEKK